MTTAERLGILAEHYRDTFDHQRSYIARRDRLFLFALVALVALAFRGTNAEQSELVVALLLKQALGAEAGLDGGFIAVILWFAFYCIVSRYFQACVTVERQYEYIEKVEEEIAALYESDVLSRESRHYLAKYPAISNWLDFVYKWIFPLAVVAVAAWNCYVEILRRGICTTTVIVVAIALSLVFTTLLFLYSTNLKKVLRGTFRRRTGSAPNPPGVAPSV